MVNDFSLILFHAYCFSIFTKHWLTRCVCETQMSLTMTNSKDGQDHKNKYVDTS